MYSEILDIIKENAGKNYTAPENLQNPVEKEAMQSLKDTMSVAANQTFKKLVEKALLLIPDSNLVIHARKGVRFLTPNGQKVRDYFWIQLKDPQRIDNSISISVFAKKDHFGITTEFADDRVTREEWRNYNKIFEKPLASGSFNYFRPRDNHNCTYEEAFQNKEKEKYQISRHIKKNEFQSDDELVNKVAESIRYLIPIYKSIYADNAPITNIQPQNPAETSAKQSKNNQSATMTQKIFFGAPGTGKSHKIDYDLFKDENGNSIGKGIKEIPENRKFRTTFHPDYDYAQFVGAYKPKKEGEKIIYSFVPQVFAKTYATAWKLQLTGAAESNVFLVIEEINRGNCAQIFGDIFQLLDRNASRASQYSIDADCDFAKWLEEEFQAEEVWNAYKKEVGGEGKLKLPPNLNILATMNTSDQSLFPMDSAFKRRFDWEYVPINYSHEKANFDVTGDGIKFKWLTFLKKVNADIYKATESEDKQMGEFFIKPKNDSNEIGLDEFRSKVLFYLWDSVYKDDPSFKNIFHFNYPEKDGSVVTFQRLFAKDPSNNQEIFPEILKQMLKNLDEAYKDSEFKDLKILNG